MFLQQIAAQKQRVCITESCRQLHFEVLILHERECLVQIRHIEIDNDYQYPYCCAGLYPMTIDLANA